MFKYKYPRVSGEDFILYYTTVNGSRFIHIQGIVESLGLSYEKELKKMKQGFNHQPASTGNSSESLLPIKDFLQWMNTLNPKNNTKWHQEIKEKMVPALLKFFSNTDATQSQNQAKAVEIMKASRKPTEMDRLFRMSDQGPSDPFLSVKDTLKYLGIDQAVKNWVDAKKKSLETNHGIILKEGIDYLPEEPNSRGNMEECLLSIKTAAIPVLEGITKKIWRGKRNQLIQHIIKHFEYLNLNLWDQVRDRKSVEDSDVAMAGLRVTERKVTKSSFKVEVTKTEKYSEFPSISSMLIYEVVATSKDGDKKHLTLVKWNDLYEKNLVSGSITQWIRSVIEDNILEEGIDWVITKEVKVDKDGKKKGQGKHVYYLTEDWASILSRKIELKRKELAEKELKSSNSELKNEIHETEEIPVEVEQVSVEPEVEIQKEDSEKLSGHESPLGKEEKTETDYTGYSREERENFSKVFALVPWSDNKSSLTGIDAELIYNHSDFETSYSYNKWITRNLLSKPFYKEGIDYIRIPHDEKNSKGGTPTFRDVLTFRTAFHLAMRLDTVEGFKVRDYFIDRDEELRLREAEDTKRIVQEKVELESKVKELQDSADNAYTVDDAELKRLYTEKRLTRDLREAEEGKAEAIREKALLRKDHEETLDKLIEKTKENKKLRQEGVVSEYNSDCINWVTLKDNLEEIGFLDFTVPFIKKFLYQKDLINDEQAQEYNTHNEKARKWFVYSKAQRKIKKSLHNKRILITPEGQKGIPELFMQYFDIGVRYEGKNDEIISKALKDYDEEFGNG